jgi:hypothetical protein
MGLFAAFLVWQHIGMQKRADLRDEKFQERLDQLREDYDKTEDNGRKLDQLIHLVEDHHE